MVIKSSLKTLFALVFVLALAGCGFFYAKYHQLAQNTSQNEAGNLVKSIGKFVQLPNEQAAIATVADRSKLSNELLAKKAKNGDKLLIFSHSKRIILYRPSSKKVVDMLSIATSTNVKNQND